MTTVRKGKIEKAINDEGLLSDYLLAGWRVVDKKAKTETKGEEEVNEKEKEVK